MPRITSTVTTAIAFLGAVSYPLLLLFVLGTSFSPFNPESSWGLAAEHGELEFEHWAHFIVAIIAAFPFILTSRLTTSRAALFLLVIFSLAASLPYLMQPARPFESNSSWLATYAWQIDAAEVALAPLLLAATLAAITWRRSRIR